MIGIEEFKDFFEAIHGAGIRPFAWQEELLGHLVSTGRWPEQIVAPTGSGKSCVVEAHIFATALSAVGAAPRLPRRLAVVVNRRALTDAHAQRAERIRDLLAQEPPGGGILGRVREALAGLRSSGAGDCSPLVVATMRGAAATDRDWLNAPEACAVLCMTPAMWASSLLFRSYGASRFARPRLAGMLALDAAVVLDEAHLSRQVLVTARRSAQLCATSAQRLGVPGLQAVEMTATPSDHAGGVVGVTRRALERDPHLAERVRAAKTAVYEGTDAWPAAGGMTAAYRKAVVGQVLLAVEEARRLLPEGPDGAHAPRTVGCVLNRVDSAVRVADALRREHDLSVRLWVGRMRPWDLQRLRIEDPGLFGPAGSRGVDVLVATQTIEVGVDLDLVSVVTELAPASALAQRAGRVNRMGRRSRGRLVVLGPPAPEPVTRDAAPYSAGDLEAGREWILGRAADGDLSPLAVSEAPPPPQSPRRVLWQRPEPWDLALWAKTSMDLVIEPELDLWIRDDLEPETGAVGVVLRDLAGLPDTTACETLLTAVPPQEREVFPATIGTARSVVERLAGAPDRPLEHSVLWREGAVLAQWQATVAGEPRAVRDALRPGDVLVLDASVPLLTGGVVTERGEQEGRPVPDGDLEGIVAVVTDPQELERLGRLDPEEVCEAFPGQIVEWPAAWDEAQGPAWMVRRRVEDPDEDSEEHSAWSVSRRVRLSDHHAAVAERAERLGEGLGLGPRLVSALAQAGQWHDVGKGDERFQRLLRGRGVGDGEPLAKSGGRVLRSVRRAWADAGLPPGWRHELASAAAYWEHAEATAGDPGGTGDPEGSGEAGQAPMEVRDLVTRLVGTSHGRGRPLFDHDPALAGPGHAQALELLVGQGEWESLIARTDRRWGLWGTAYLEALLRAADCTISAEGK